VLIFFSLCRSATKRRIDDGRIQSTASPDVQADSDVDDESAEHAAVVRHGAVEHEQRGVDADDDADDGHLVDHHRDEDNEEAMADDNDDNDDNDDDDDNDDASADKEEEEEEEEDNDDDEDDEDDDNDEEEDGEPSLENLDAPLFQKIMAYLPLKDVLSVGEASHTLRVRAASNSLWLLMIERSACSRCLRCFRWALTVDEKHTPSDTEQFYKQFFAIKYLRCVDVGERRSYVAKTMTKRCVFCSERAQ
jgi:hypothetical protein